MGVRLRHRFGGKNTLPTRRTTVFQEFQFFHITRGCKSGLLIGSCWWQGYQNVTCVQLLRVFGIIRFPAN
jgi:hypothetical protein